MKNRLHGLFYHLVIISRSLLRLCLTRLALLATLSASGEGIWERQYFKILQNSASG